jgi:alanyl-tRNA synthetase
MRSMDSEAVRGEFLDYFREHGHLLVPGGSLVPRNDPTLLFINSGMAPMKAYFTGAAKPPARDLTNVQGCIRTKDIDDVGDRHHLTFFEMLGSWSIGGYFKREAIELAFGLLTGPYGFSPDDLYVTIFEGDPALGLAPDEESATAWAAIGIPRDHIVPQPTADNFWGPAGETGPCGPCTEVFLDTGEKFGPAWAPGKEFDTTRRYIEIWNAGVFMQFDKGADGVLRPLPFTSVDTGSGLERVAMALNSLDNVYETDLLLPVVQAAQELFGESGEILQRHRVIADHLRASSMIMCEGIRPGNEGAGYIPRRLIRRCLTTALHAGVEKVDFTQVIDTVIARLGAHHPLLRSQRANLLDGVDAECREFESVVRRGLDRLDSILSGTSTLAGADAFRLFATYGLPFEITQDIAGERGVAVSVDDFQTEFQRHQELSRGTARQGGSGRGAAAAVLQDLPPTQFDGYTALAGTATVQALAAATGRVNEAQRGESVDLVTDRTPFYAEGGGQIGDRGSLRGPAGAAQITDTVSLDGGQYVHKVTVTEGVIQTGDLVELEVDQARRADTAANHSATHLLNAALRDVLGEHVRQAGSLVEPERLRFDFTHPTALAKDQLRQVERLVNTWILGDHARTVVELPQEEAKASGAISLEGEDYGPGNVRVVAFTGVSRELCGGTHVDHTSLIGTMRIRSEQSVASGVRRINAVTRFAALELAENQEDTLAAVAAALRTSPRDAVATAQRLVSSTSKKAAAPKAVDSAQADRALTDLEAGGVQLSLGQLDMDVAALRRTVLNLAGRRDRVIVVWSAPDGPAQLVVAVPERYRSKVSAADLVRGIAGRYGGSGGGSAGVAQGGGMTFDGEDGPRNLLAELLGGQLSKVPSKRELS